MNNKQSLEEAAREYANKMPASRYYNIEISCAECGFIDGGNYQKEQDKELINKLTLALSNLVKWTHGTVNHVTAWQEAKELLQSIEQQ